MSSPQLIAQSLSFAFIAGDLQIDAMVSRGAEVLGKRWRWLRPLATRVHATFSHRRLPRPSKIARFICEDHGFLTACAKHNIQPVIWHSPPAMTPFAAAQDWNIPALHTSRDLAEWLNVRFSELDWFADLKRWEQKRNRGALRNYHYRVLHKRFGRVRLIEAPKPRLKAIQRRILDEILSRIPLHDAAHGFRQGRSVKSFAAPHVAKQVVLKIDLHDFFPTIIAARIQAIFRFLGYPEVVASILTGLCCNSTPHDVWNQIEAPAASHHDRGVRFLYARPHLPQGAPTSPALANLCAFHLDCRLSALASAASATYTRYADDLAFSGECEFARTVHRFRTHACAIIGEEGFRVFHHKTRLMRRGVRQQIAGVVVNDRMNVNRVDFDRLKAILTNCVRNGPNDQNRANSPDLRSHLLGQISYVAMLNPSRGQKLRCLFDRIKW
jgi:RNA-directed DNA polymerase